jgi:hypothetical protein
MPTVPLPRYRPINRAARRPQVQAVLVTYIGGPRDVSRVADFNGVQNNGSSPAEVEMSVSRGEGISSSRMLCPRHDANQLY